MTDPLLNTKDPISAGIRDPEGYRQVLAAPCEDRARMMAYFDAKQRAIAKRIARRIASRADVKLLSHKV